MDPSDLERMHQIKFWMRSGVLSHSFFLSWLQALQYGQTLQCLSNSCFLREFIEGGVCGCIRFGALILGIEHCIRRCSSIPRGQSVAPRGPNSSNMDKHCHVCPIPISFLDWWKVLNGVTIGLESALPSTRHFHLQLGITRRPVPPPSPPQSYRYLYWCLYRSPYWYLYWSPYWYLYC